MTEDLRATVRQLEENNRRLRQRFSDLKHQSHDLCRVAAELCETTRRWHIHDRPARPRYKPRKSADRTA